MKVIILCAGLGSRLNSKKPKCFLEVNGKPIINYIVENLIKNGFKKKDIIFATGFKNQLIKKKFGKNYSYIFNRHYRSTNMVYTLFNCLKETKNQDIIVSYSDIIYNKSNIKKLIDSKSQISTVVDVNWKKIWKRKNKLLTDSETLKIKKNRIIELGKKTKDIKNIDGRYVGILKFSSKIINDLVKIYFLNLKLNNQIFKKIDMTNFLNFLIKSNFRISSVKLSGSWNEYDDISDLNYDKKFLKNV